MSLYFFALEQKYHILSVQHSLFQIQNLCTENRGGIQHLGPEKQGLLLPTRLLSHLEGRRNIKQ